MGVGPRFLVAQAGREFAGKRGPSPMSKPNRWVIAPTLLVVGRYHIVVYPNDHSPPHVHIVGSGHAKFLIGSTPDDVNLLEHEGVQARDLRRIAEVTIDRHRECLAGWRKYRGD